MVTQRSQPVLEHPELGMPVLLVKTETFSGVLACGGFTEQDGDSHIEDYHILDTCELYDFESEEWHGTGNINIGRIVFELLPLGGGILALGGAVYYLMETLKFLLLWRSSIFLQGNGIL